MSPLPQCLLRLLTFWTCPVRQICIAKAECDPCDEGRYCPNVSAALLCPPGAYCGAGSITYMSCPAG
jgi:hypothetical protein